MRKLQRFWRALEALPGLEAERLEWRRLLGDEWPVVEPLLCQTGALVERVWCPSPSGYDCPRRVVRHDDDRIVAVCGDQPRNCETLLLSLDEIAVLELDVRRLSTALARPLGLYGSPRWISEPDLLQLGIHQVAAGLGVPILLVWARTSEQTDRAIASLVHSVAGPFALTTPTYRFLGPETREKIKLTGGMHVCLCDAIGADDRDMLIGERASQAIFAPLREVVAANAGEARLARTWVLPADARWEDFTFEFVAAEVVNLRFRGETRRFEPEHLGMKNQRSGRPTLQWTLLQQMALGGGQLAWADPGATTRIKKQKQELSDKLKAAFGVEGDPIEWDGDINAYIARFALRATGLRS